ncbi:uncharacterized protein CLUP02_16477 [Colletotrichum lupini]|uniref:Uncharacterized protein n=1 Tax=Colletotrichum lupini TaxID=145971 RepID=A0A9Q8T8H9_9PEZI|nr:uncharacterized protein CLUP02_16477 [Colletotrichum lupini]UQC90945.1 hypothetical protein CLUP02_16477 [Colletotrichum lupini]
MSPGKVRDDIATLPMTFCEIGFYGNVVLGPVSLSIQSYCAALSRYANRIRKKVNKVHPDQPGTILDTQRASESVWISNFPSPVGAEHRAAISPSDFSLSTNYLLHQDEHAYSLFTVFSFPLSSLSMYTTVVGF